MSSPSQSDGMSPARPALVVWGGVLLAVLGLLLRHAGLLGSVIGREQEWNRTGETTASVGTALLYAAVVTVVAGALVALVPALSTGWFWAGYALCVFGLAVRTLREA